MLINIHLSRVYGMYLCYLASHFLSFVCVCGVKEFGNPSPFNIKLKAPTEKEEMSKDERRRSKLPGDVAEDNPVLGKPRSRKEEAAHHRKQSPKASQGKAQVQRISHGSIVEEQFQDKLSPPH